MIVMVNLRGIVNLAMMIKMDIWVSLVILDSTENRGNSNCWAFLFSYKRGSSQCLLSMWVLVRPVYIP